MTGKTRVFVSSTVYNLADLRNAVYKCLSSLGHEPVLSEFPVFPIDPSIEAIENCKVNVRANTDLFLLIISSRYGYVDEKTQRSIVKLEYEAAVNAGIDILVFVDKRVFELYDRWTLNQAVELGDIVDSVEVLKFIQQIQKEQRWILRFESNEDLISSLIDQLSVRLRTLLSLKNEGRLKPLREYLEESSKAHQLALDKPKHWEFLLLEEIAKTKIGKTKRRLQDLINGSQYQSCHSLMLAPEMIVFYQSQLVDFMNLHEFTNQLINVDLKPALGSLGQSGDLEEMKLFADKLLTLCNGIYDWEAKLRFTRAPDDWMPIIEALRGGTGNLFAALEQLPLQLTDVIPQLDGTDGVHVISLSVDDFSFIQRAGAEFQRVFGDLTEL